MSNHGHSYLHFFVDQDLVGEGMHIVLEDILKRKFIDFSHDEKKLNENQLNVIFTLPKKNKKNTWPKSKVIICPYEDTSDGGQSIRCDFFNTSEVENIIENIIEAWRISWINNKIKDSEKQLEYMRGLNEHKSEEEIYTQHEFIEKIYDLELCLLKTDNLNDWNDFFKNYTADSHFLESLLIGKYADVLAHLQDEISRELDSAADDDGAATWLFKTTYEEYFLYFKFRKLNFNENSLSLELLTNMLFKSIESYDQNLIRNDEEIDFWKRIFAKIPYPMAVITNFGDLLSYNELFAKLRILPKECLNYRDQESIEIQHHYYIVKKIEFEISLQQVFFLVFYTAERLHLNSPDKKSSVDDLGIVSSSIAHELNNPLAGILAALSLLPLEENWNEESLIEINDMKNGAKRCKELIEIFLGFSRMSPNQSCKVTLRDSLDQAINLLRFRMIESNLRIEMRHYPTLEHFTVEINASVLSMILYLIISELMTAFAHFRLVTDRNSNLMSGDVIELFNQVIIRLDDDFDFEEKLSHSKLIQHLLMFEKMEINFSKREVRLIHL